LFLEVPVGNIGFRDHGSAAEIFSHGDGIQEEIGIQIGPSCIYLVK